MPGVPKCSGVLYTLLSGLSKNFHDVVSINNLPSEYFFYNRDWKQWIVTNLKTTDSVYTSIQWNVLFGVAMDEIWHPRNAFVFKQSNCSSQSIFRSILGRAKVIMELENRVTKLHPGTELHHSPPTDNCSLCCDGSVSNQDASAGCGGLLRDESGKFIFGFTQRLDRCSP